MRAPNQFQSNRHSERERSRGGGDSVGRGERERRYRDLLYVKRGRKREARERKAEKAEGKRKGRNILAGFCLSGVIVVIGIENIPIRWVCPCVCVWMSECRTKSIKTDVLSCQISKSSF